MVEREAWAAGDQSKSLTLTDSFFCISLFNCFSAKITDKPVFLVKKVLLESLFFAQGTHNRPSDFTISDFNTVDTGGKAAVATSDTDSEERFLQLPGAYDSILDVGEVTEG